MMTKESKKHKEEEKKHKEIKEAPESLEDSIEQDQAVQLEDSDAIPPYHSELVAKTNMGVLPTPLYSELEDPESFSKRN
ncbi:hypothetical protein F9B85_13450 [Heliorestis acidaminivorans]|uniref:Uncharacterized protein n=1 Tax=Heliorestis acidaminivorans TaxID=553427 RepID=A0A6I0EPP0_9FIRM|nr:hypothetical protein [Heliorestis acidaminivorans]KAB2951205.1 hypothetical protein F9B85_13450 [Heliorestis acidaminivorans]